MTPGIGDRLKKIAKTVNDAERALQTTEAVLQGRPLPPTSAYGSPSPASPAPPPPANARCGYCGGLVTRGTSKCPNCNAPM